MRRHKLSKINPGIMFSVQRRTLKGPINFLTFFFTRHAFRQDCQNIVSQNKLAATYERIKIN